MIRTQGASIAALRGALWMALASFSFVASAAATRELAGTYSVFELAFLRCLVGLALLSPMLVRAGAGAMRTTQFGLHFLRTALTYIGVLFWFYAVSVVPVADFFALQFTTPLFTIGCAVVFLRERAGAASWIATLVGFAGVLVILRPGLIEVSLGALAALAASAGYAGVNTMVKILSRRDSATVMVFYVNLLILPLSLVPALLAWRMPSWADAPLILGIGVFSTLAQFSVARAIAVADARVVQPVNFLRLPMAAAVGYAVFGEVADAWTWTGAAIIFASAYYVVRRESRPAEG